MNVKVIIAKQSYVSDIVNVTKTWLIYNNSQVIFHNPYKDFPNPPIDWINEGISPVIFYPDVTKLTEFLKNDKKQLPCEWKKISSQEELNLFQVALNQGIEVDNCVVLQIPLYGEYFIVDKNQIVTNKFAHFLDYNHKMNWNSNFEGNLTTLFNSIDKPSKNGFYHVYVIKNGRRKILQFDSFKQHSNPEYTTNFLFQYFYGPFLETIKKSVESYMCKIHKIRALFMVDYCSQNSCDDYHGFDGVAIKIADEIIKDFVTKYQKQDGALNIEKLDSDFKKSKFGLDDLPVSTVGF
jgi:hypothetical protein